MSPAAKKADPGAAIEGFESEGWKPEAGDFIIGTMEGLSAGWSDYKQGKYPIITLKCTEAGSILPDAAEGVNGEQVGQSISIHAFQTTLERMLIETQPKVGETVKITCGGKRATRDGKRSVMLYRLEVPGREGQAAGDWSQFGAQPAPAPVAGIDPATGEITDGSDHPFDS